MQNEILESAISLVKECGERLRSERFSHIRKKAGCYDLVSDLDEEIENYLIAQLSHRYPSHHFIGEEQHVGSGLDLWIIDPIDGTTNFINAHEDFAISVAYYHDQKPVFGVVYDVMRDELFVGIHKQGSYCNGQKLQIKQDKEVSDCVLDMSLHTMHSIDKAYGKSMLELQGKIRGHRSLGCASLCICHIANRTLDVYLSMHLKCWDYAAAAIILKEAGGYFDIAEDFFTMTSTGAVFTNHSSIQQYFLENFMK